MYHRLLLNDFSRFQGWSRTSFYMYMYLCNFASTRNVTFIAHITELSGLTEKSLNLVLAPNLGPCGRYLSWSYIYDGFL